MDQAFTYFGNRYGHQPREQLRPTRPAGTANGYCSAAADAAAPRGT